MKLNAITLSGALVATAAASGAAASSSSSSAAASSSANAAKSSASASDEPVVTVTTYVDDCSTTSAPGSGSAGAGMNSGSMTTYTTIFETWCGCEAGMTAATYTITEPCTMTDQPLPVNHVPSGFTVVTEACTICVTPTTGVITRPIVPTAQPLVPQQLNGNGSGPASAPASGSGSGTAPAPAPVEQPAVGQTNGTVSPPIQHANGAASNMVFAWTWSAVAAAISVILF